MVLKLLQEIAEYPKVLAYLERTYDDPRVLKTIKRGFWILAWILKDYRSEVRKCEKRYREVRKKGMVMNLNGKHSDIKFYLPLLKIENHRVVGEYIQRMIFKTENYFDISSLQWLKKKKIVGRGMNILDIGANIGNHTIYFAKECKVNYIYAFEPISSTYRMLCKNCGLNGLDNVSLNNLALGRKKSSVQIKSFNRENYGGTSLRYDRAGGGMPCVALDELSIDKKIDFIKIDVEGFENEVLLGGAGLIRRDRPAIYVEIFEENKEAVEKTLRDFGYVRKEKRYDDYLYLPSSI